MIQKIISPFQKFVKIESLSGILLFTATVIALIWANSPYGHVYESIWQYKIGIRFQNFELEKSLILWINDGLMAIFFFLTGLELKREFLIGELDTIKKATFPFIAALGGVIAPIALFFILNKNPETTNGWGIPMATDIAFALAILKLLGNRVPLSIKVFLTAFAIIDDIGAVLVIALFYSATINWMLLVYALILLSILGFLAYRKIYINYIYLFSGIIIWFGAPGVGMQLAQLFVPSVYLPHVWPGSILLKDSLSFVWPLLFVNVTVSVTGIGPMFTTRNPPAGTIEPAGNVYVPPLHVIVHPDMSASPGPIL